MFGKFEFISGCKSLVSHTGWVTRIETRLFALGRKNTSSQEVVGRKAFLSGLAWMTAAVASMAFLAVSFIWLSGATLPGGGVNAWATAASICLFFSAFMALIYCEQAYRAVYGPAPSARNSTVESQIRLVAHSIRNCEFELIIYSGEFHHDVYESPEVLAALRVLKNQSVKLYCQRKEVDPSARNFDALCKEKDWKVTRDLRSNQAHFLIVDRTDCRIEFHNGTTGGEQPARYFPGRPDYCRKILRAFARNVTQRRPDINRELLPSASFDLSDAA